jgi:hypothetical protein
MQVILKNPLSLFGRNIRFRFDNYAWIVMCEVNNIEFHQIQELQERVLLITLIYGAYVSDCRYNAKREKYTLKDMYEIFKKLSQENIDELKLAIYNSRLLGKTMAEWADEGEKAEKKK